MLQLLPLRPFAACAASLFLLGCFGCTEAWAQSGSGPISTDRPGVYFSSDTVPWGAGQVEMGGEFLRFDLEREDLLYRGRQANTPVIFRFGVFENLEFRLGTPGAVWLEEKLTADGKTEYDRSDSGFSYPTLGVKWQISGAGEGHPALGVLLNWALPVGSDAFSPKKSEFDAVFLADFPLADNASLVFNGGLLLRYDEETKGCFQEGLGALAFVHTVRPSVDYFVELAGGGPQSDGGEGFLQADGGILVRPQPSWQLDFAVSRGLTRYSTDWGLSVGLSFLVFSGF